MTAKEALEIRHNFRQGKMVGVDLEAIGECIDNALEKQVPKKPILSDSQIRYVCCYDCPNCGRIFSGTGIADYCYHCGQALDWSDEDA